ncbi:serine hydroxymethyltransferase [Mesorhizobium sp. M1060]|uniref:serine hydroxymethyltransferase n=1 Tax=Mesorhizobium sp. M1060 TaxID=2957052 RepID=UPI00333A1437
MAAPSDIASGDAFLSAAGEKLADLGAQQMRLERSVINLIASDNALPRKFAEYPPYPGHIIQEGLVGARPFAGAALHDEIERLAAAIACRVFSAEHANLQPHSCSQANQAVYHALLKPGDPVLALGFRDGGHLTHGLGINFSGRLYRFSYYHTGADGLIDYENAEALARSLQPKLIVCGSSSYPRWYNGERLRAISDLCGAVLMFDLSHEAGLIAGGALSNLVPLADVATMSLDKTLRGPFGGMILCKKALAGRVDRAVHPGTQSSFPIRRLTDSAAALIASQTPDFAAYARNTVETARVLGSALAARGAVLLTGGTDKHYVVVDTFRSYGISGAKAERALEGVDMLSSRQTLPDDASQRSNAASGLRLGAAWISSRGYLAKEAHAVAGLVHDTLTGARRRSDIREQVRALAGRARTLDVWR